MKNIPYGHQSITDDDIQAVVSVLKSEWLTQGPNIREFEEALAKKTGAQFAVATSSGTAALHCACLAAGIKASDEVITSPITFTASANCVLYCGGEPVFADITKNTANICPEEIKKKITKKTKAVIPVHYAGHPCDLEEIHEISKENKLTVIEDAAHALGAQYKESKIGSCKYSDMTICSFHPVKHITTGEGGAILTNSKYYYEKLMLFRNHGITKDENKYISQKMKKSDWYYEMHELGFNYRITDFQCALGISQLKKLDSFIKRRREIVAYYNSSFKDIADIVLPIEKENVMSAWHLYYLRFKNGSIREHMYNSLKNRGIGTQVHYIPVYLQPFYQKQGLKKKSCPIAEDFFMRELSIPIYPTLSEGDMEYVATTIADIVRKGFA